MDPLPQPAWPRSASRRTPRVPWRAASRRGPTRRFLGYISNLSESGAFIQCSIPRPEGTQLSVRLYLGPNEEQGVDFDAQVVWTRGYGGRSNPAAGMGIEFTSIGAKARDVILRLCEVRDPRPNPRL